MIRHVETSRWRDPWRRKLSTRAKLFFDWLCDNCDNAGVIDLDFSVASFDIGEPIDESHLSELGNRVQRLPNGKINIVKFVIFQHKTLRPTPGKGLSNLKKSAIQLLKHHGLPLPDEGELVKPSDSPIEALKERSITPNCAPKERTSTGTGTGTGKVQQAGSERLIILKEGLCGLYDRKPGNPWSYVEESALFEVCKRTDCVEELADLRNYQRANGKYFPKSIVALLSDWPKHLDAAASHKREQRGFKSEGESKEIQERKRQAKEALERARNHAPD